MSYTPPDAHHVILNFKDPLTAVDSHNVILNFGADDVVNYLDAVIDLSIIAEMLGTYQPPLGSLNLLDAVIDLSCVAEMLGSFDYNHIVGVQLSVTADFSAADTYHTIITDKMYKPLPWSHAPTLPFGHAVQVNINYLLPFEQATKISNGLDVKFEQAARISTSNTAPWQENLHTRVGWSAVFEQGIKLQHKTQVAWEEMIRKRRAVTFKHEVAQNLSHEFSFRWDKGLEIHTTTELPWDKARSIYYRKHPIQPWPKPEMPKYQGDGILNFICLCHEVDSHNVILNFGQDDCIPAIPNKNWWYIVNDVAVERLDNGAKIKAVSGNYSASRATWCWTYTLDVPASEIAKLEPIAGRPVILKISVNGAVHHMMYENYTRSRKFAEETYTLHGRSQTARLSSDYAPLRSYLQENERTSVQLCQAELDRVFSETVLDWQLIDELGWIVETQSLSYTNLAPIDAIKMVVEAGGGMVTSAKDSDALIIKPLYKKSFWDAMTIGDYDCLLPISLVDQHTEDHIELDDFNGITLTNPLNGNIGLVKRTATAGDITLESASNPLFNAVSMASFGKSKLSRAGKVETHDFSTVINSEFSESTPGEVLAFNGEWWGIVDSVSVSFSYDKVSQKLKVERVNNE